MEVRCGGCNKLFRVSDDKITGSGIKFPCTKCGEYVKITREEFDTYTLSQSTVSALDMFVPKPPKTAKTEPQPAPVAMDAPAQEEAPVPVEMKAPDQSLEEPAAAEAASEELSVDDVFNSTEFTSLLRPTDDDLTESTEVSSAAGSGAAVSEPAPAVSVAAPKKESRFEQELKSASAPAKSAPLKSEPARPVVSAARKIDAPTPSAPAFSERKYLIPALALVGVIVIAIGAFFFMKDDTPKPVEKLAVAPVQDVKEIPVPEGLQVMRASGAMDPSGDLIISGVIENTSDKVHTVWHVVADVYDANSAVLTQAKMLNGRQIYTDRDYEVLAKRGVNVKDLKARRSQELGITILPKSSVNFELRIMDPPTGIASFNALLKPFNPALLQQQP